MSESLFDRNVAKEMIALIYQFSRIPSHNIPTELPLINSHHSPHKLKNIPCKTWFVLRSFYRPYNKDLFDMLASDRASGLAPSLEPDFGTFPSPKTNPENC